ncbi:MAG: NTP transferase domain-containing protein [Burkholderiales bacterium]|nr:NTP transferase domain-containing protein [Burkholderiales bacterium]
MKKDNFEILILAAGKGKRMQSDLPKVLIEFKKKPMIKHILSSIEKAFHKKPIAIIGHGRELVKSELKDSCFYAIQEEQLGTGHAVFSAKNMCEKADHVVVLSGDQPLISPKTIKNLMEKHLTSKSKITFTTTELPDFKEWRKSFSNFGRILRKNNEVIGIRENKDASDKEKEIKEVNAGCYAFDAKWLWQNLEKIKNNNAQNEYYLTDLFKIASKNEDIIETIKIDPHEALGANSKEELEILEKIAV